MQAVAMEVFVIHVVVVACGFISDRSPGNLPFYVCAVPCADYPVVQPPGGQSSSGHTAAVCLAHSGRRILQT